MRRFKTKAISALPGLLRGLSGTDVSSGGVWTDASSREYMVAVLTKVVQEQQKTIAELSKKMSELERQLKLERNPTLASVDFSR